jgi:hypothetical protein
MNGNETPLKPVASNPVNGVFTGSNPAPRTIQFQHCPVYFQVSGSQSKSSKIRNANQINWLLCLELQTGQNHLRSKRVEPGTIQNPFSSRCWAKIEKREIINPSLKGN